MSSRRWMGTIGGRLLLLVAATGTVTAVLVSLFVLSRTYTRDRQNIVESVTSDAEVLAIHCEALLLFQDPVAARETLATLSPIEHIAVVALFDRQGMEIARYDRANVRGAPTLSYGEPGERFRGSWLIFRQPVRHGSETVGMLALAYDMSWATKEFVRNVALTLLVSLLAVGVGLLVALPLRRSISQPVQELVLASQRVARDGSFATTRARRFADDELGSLTTVFNQMLERIEEHEERLQRAHERYELVNRATNDVIWDWDLLNDRIVWNDAAEATLGRERTELGPTPAERVSRIHPEDRARVTTAIDRAIAMGTHRWGAEYRVLRKDGTYGTFVERGIIARDAGGTAYRMIGSMLDVTDRKRSEAAVQEGARRLRVLMNAVPAFVWMADGNGSMQQFNARWHDYTGVTLEEVRQGKWRRVVHPADRETLVRKWSLAVQSGVPYEHELRMRGRDGHYRWFVSRALPVQDDGGTVVGWYGTTVDIEDRRRMEDERVALLASERSARQEAEQANRMKDEFLATLSHEIRTPMSAILGWVQVLRTGDTTNMDPSVAHGLEVIERNARAQAQLIEDLLDMSRVISGKLRLEGRNVDLVEVIEAATSTVHPAAIAKRIAIRTELDRGCIVYGDATRLQQMVWNLLTNAVKFTGSGGAIHVTLRPIGDRAQIAVSDDGEGIDPGFLPYLFERFRQADSSTTRRFGGLGLGLAIVKQLTELHGGTVAARSEGNGYGATFTIELPLSPELIHGEAGFDEVTRSSPAPRSGSIHQDVRARPRQRGRILLVEDEHDTREAMTRLLERNGYRVTSVSSATEALTLLPDLSPEVLISDIGMPGMDGHDLIRQVRQRPKETGGNVVALALTAFTRSEDRERALSAGYDAHLGKPVDESELLLCLRRIGRTASASGQRGSQPTSP